MRPKIRCDGESTVLLQKLLHLNWTLDGTGRWSEQCGADGMAQLHRQRRARTSTPTMYSKSREKYCFIWIGRTSIQYFICEPLTCHLGNRRHACTYAAIRNNFCVVCRTCKVWLVCVGVADWTRGLVQDGGLRCWRLGLLRPGIIDATPRLGWGEQRVVWCRNMHESYWTRRRRHFSRDSSYR
jgi:hypothetical protein